MNVKETKEYKKGYEIGLSGVDTFGEAINIYETSLTTPERDCFSEGYYEGKDDFLDKEFDVRNKLKILKKTLDELGLKIYLDFDPDICLINDDDKYISLSSIWSKVTEDDIGNE